MDKGMTTARRTRIFVSYRREDSEQAAGRLADDLRRHFPADQVFQDIASIDPGADFVDALQSGLATCAAVLVVIGPRWATVTDARGRLRLHVEEDWVRHEVAESLRDKSVRVFPVLVDNAAMPAMDGLPESLAALTRRQAFPLTTRHWPKDIDELVQHLRRVPGLDRPVAGSQPQTQPDVEPRRPERSPPQASRPGSAGAPAKPAAPSGEDGRTGGGSTEPSAWRKGGWLIAGISAIAVVLGWAIKGGDPEPPPAATPPEVAAPTPTPTPTQAKPPAPAAAAPDRDCPGCPEMVVVPAGSFTMGSPENEVGRDADEGPPRKVTIERAFALGKFHVTRGQFAAFVKETGHDAGNACVVLTEQKLEPQAGKTWRDPGFRQTDDDPVVCVNWSDATAYTAWLARKTGKRYRLPTEAEWEYAARAGTTGRRFWGDAADSCRHANVPDAALKAQFSFFDTFACNDGYAETAPVGRFLPNRFGLHDMLGNAFHWTADCWNKNYVGAPADGQARTLGDCGRRALRGGSWYESQHNVRSAAREESLIADRDFGVGFRVARTE
jgi:formylglycine-generating enzyme required for sulfatase activity